MRVDGREAVLTIMRASFLTHGLPHARAPLRAALLTSVRTDVRTYHGRVPINCLATDCNRGTSIVLVYFLRFRLDFRRPNDEFEPFALALHQGDESRGVDPRD
jgi:hypothetical protein